MTKSTVSYRFGHVYWSKPKSKTSLFGAVIPLNFMLCFCFIIYFNQILWWCSNSVNSFLPSDSFWSPWKHQKTFGFLMFLGGLKRIIGKKRFKIEQFAHILIFVIYLLYIYYLFIYLFIYYNNSMRYLNYRVHVFVISLVNL